MADDSILAGSGADAQLGAPNPAEIDAVLTDLVDLVAVIEPDGKVRYLNRAGRRLLGLPDRGQLPQLSAFEHVASSDLGLLEREVLPALAMDSSWAGSISLVAASGADVPTRSTLRRIHGDSGAPDTITWIARDISTEKAVYERLHKTIFEDELTGLPHRSILLDRLDLALRGNPDHRTGVGLCFVSLDRFKEKNDRFGREGGDALLRQVGRRLLGILGPTDTASRWGGDEFVVMCESLVDQPDPLSLAHRILEAFEEPYEVDGHPVFLSASVGVAVSGRGELTTDLLLRHAEAAGQMAKQGGGGRIHQFDAEMQARVRRRAEIEDGLRGAADRGELTVHYQPQVELRTSRIVAVEALVRWQHPNWGLVSPTEFIPVAEATGLILDVGRHVVTVAMSQCAQWRLDLGEAAPTVSINISPRQFEQDDFVEMVADTLALTGADPADICLEITESVLMEDMEVTAATLRRLKALGVQLAVDDFGTGYSSLTYLRAFPVDIIKVDQSFVAGLGRDAEDAAIVRAVVSMGQALDLTTVAEGVETAHHVIELRELNCDIAQGYHFARPASAETTTLLLEAGPDWQRIT